MVRLVVNISNEVDSWLRSQAKRKGDLSKIVNAAILFYATNANFEEVKT